MKRYDHRVVTVNSLGIGDSELERLLDSGYEIHTATPTHETVIYVIRKEIV